MIEDDLDRLLEAAGSAAWEERKSAATSLARFDDPRAAAALSRLLRDPADTAVIESAARALAARADPYGAELIFRALAETDAEDEDDDGLLLFFLLRDAEVFESSGLHAAARQAATAHDDEVIRNGAQILLDYLSGATYRRDDAALKIHGPGGGGT